MEGGGVRGPRCADDEDVRRLRFRSRPDRFRRDGEVLNIEKQKLLFSSSKKKRFYIIYA